MGRAGSRLHYFRLRTRAETEIDTDNRGNKITDRVDGYFPPK